MRRILLLIAGGLILLAVTMPIAALYYLIFTESGFHFIIDHVPHTVAGAQLEFTNPSGTVANGMYIERVEIDHHLVHLRIEELKGGIKLVPLLWQTVHARTVAIKNISIQVKRRTKPPVPGEAFFLPRWLIVVADHARVDSIVLTVPSGNRFGWTNLYATGTARHRRIRLFDVGLQTGDARLNGTADLHAADPMKLDVDARIGWTPAEQPAWSADATANGDLNALALNIHTTAPFRSDFTGQALDLTGQWHWRGNTIVHDFDITAWGGSNILGLLKGELALKGNQDGFAARGPLISAGLAVGVFDTAFEGAYADHVVWAKHFDITHHDSRAHVVGSGSIAVVKNGPHLNLQGTWRDFRWPLIGKNVPVHSSAGEYTLQGTWPYSLHANGIATIRDLPPMPMRVQGTLAKDRFSFDTAEVDVSDGHASLTGAAVWTPAQRWFLAGRAMDINPGRFRDDLPGRMNFEFAAQGRTFDANGDFSLDVHDIGGRLRGVNASGGGKLARTGGTWHFDGVRVGLGRTNLSLDGRINDAFDLRFAVTAQDLSLISPDSHGQLAANGTVLGTLKRPTVAATARGVAIEHAGVTINSFDADIDFDPSPEYESRVDAHIHNLTYQNRTLENLTFKLSGKATDYAVRVDAKALGLAGVIQANGPFANGAWTGELRGMTVTGTESLHLDLERPAGILISADAMRADWMCVVGLPASMCIDGDWSAKQWHTTFTANEIPLSTFTDSLSQTVQYGGRINVLAKLFGSPDAPPQGTVRLDLTDAQLSHRLSSGRIEHSTIGSGLVSVKASSSTLTAEVGLESGDVGTIKGRIDAQRVSDNWQKLPVKGELHAHTEQLGLITLYVPEIDRAAGHLDADMEIAGTLGTPFINGDLKISGGEIDYYQVNLGLRQLAFDARLTDNGLDFSGSTHIGGGVADAKGRLEWRNSLPYGKVQIQGTNLRVVDIPEAQIDASPDLEFNINGRRIEVAGAVKVPFAKIVPRDLSGAVRISSDEVIVGQEKTDPSKRFEVVSAITLGLGDHVSIDTTGLTGRLKGNITVRSGYDEVTSATGELSIEQGKYTTYARKLDIERGRLIFSGGPIGNPGIDIRAIKEFPDVIAGVNVRGTLLQPRLSFFSDPSLTQSQIVSLILAGGSLETAQNRQSGAGNELLAQGGAILAQQLGSRVGIEDVSLESDLTNETSLVLGRYLSPRLYVSYGIALTETLNVLKLRYSLTDHWTIKTEVGQARGADLVYTLKK
jgi:translocation and assembly module TamB